MHTALQHPDLLSLQLTHPEMPCMSGDGGLWETGNLFVVEACLHVDLVGETPQSSAEDDPSMRRFVPNFTNRSGRVLHFLKLVQHV